MITLVADIETNGLLIPKPGEQPLTEIFLLAILNLQTDEYNVYTGDDILEGLIRLEEADRIVGHNWLDFDICALEAIYGVTLRRDHVRDTLCASRFAGRFTLKTDETSHEVIEIPHRGHNLDSWGRRLKFPKGDIDHERYAGRRWVDLSAEEQAEMLKYAERDVRLTAAVYQQLKHVWQWYREAMRLEQSVMALLPQQTRHGIRFDVKAAIAHAETLTARRDELAKEIREIFPAHVEHSAPKTVAAKQTWRSELGGEVIVPRGTVYYPIEVVETNPRSRQQMIEHFKALGWEPLEFTERGNPQLNRAALDQMPFEEAKPLIEFYDVEKRLGMLETGRQSWLNCVCPDGRIYGSVASIGASTHRMAHFAPNLAQVPSGADERGLFIASEGMVFVDVDAVGLEARIQAHYFTRYDNGQYRDALLGGQDLHTLNQQATKAATRGAAKALLYAFSYGARPFRLGHIDAVAAIKAGLLTEMPSRADRKRRGREIGDALADTMPGLIRCIEDIQDEFTRTGSIVALDGRRLFPTSPHTAFNTLVESAGAIVMKRALVIFSDWKRHHNDVYFCGNIHDELLLECPPEKAEMVAEAAKQAIREAGEYYHLLCPMAGDSHTGRTWRDVH